jgi:hypothetical protein
MGQADHTPGSNPRDLTIPRSNILGARDFRPTSARVKVTFFDPAIIQRA